MHGFNLPTQRRIATWIESAEVWPVRSFGLVPQVLRNEDVCMFDGLDKGCNQRRVVDHITTVLQPDALLIRSVPLLRDGCEEHLSPGISPEPLNPRTEFVAISFASPMVIPSTRTSL